MLNITKVRILKPFPPSLSAVETSLGLALGEICDASKRDNGWLIFHRTGWWSAPSDYCEEIKETKEL